jgi:hypothetical protein
MKDANTTQKLLFALAVMLAVSLAVWGGVKTDVEAPVQSTSQAGFNTPF